MKYKILLLLLVLITSKTFSQTTFTFNGIGDWTDVTKWTSGNYPGTTVDANEIVEIYGKVTIAQATIITNNGTISSFSSANGDTPEVNILGGLVNNTNINFSRATITVTVSGSIATNGTSELVITDNSKLTNTGSIAISGGTISVNSSVSSITNDGNGTISNSGALKVLSGTFENKSTVNNSVSNNGLFEITNGSVINRGIFFNNTNGNLLISRTFTNESTGRIDNSGVITVTGLSAGLGNSGNLNNNKNINLEDSSILSMTTNSIFTNQNSGLIVVSTSSKIVNNALDFSIQGGKVINGGTIDNNTSLSIGNIGELQNNGTLNNNFGAQINNLGTVSGINTVHTGSFSNGSVFSPGNANDATGLYKLDGFLTSYNQTATGSLNIQLAGNIAGDNYDQVIVNRDATLDGTLNVSLINGFEPNPGDVFTILREGRNLSGSFATVNLPTLSGGKVWNAVEYNNTDGVRISVNPTLLSVSDIDKEFLKFKIYPNPVSDKIYISGVSTISNVSIYDLNGRRILEAELSNVNSSIDLSALPFGVYLLKVKEETFKFVKM